MYWGNNEELGDIMPHPVNIILPQASEYMRADLYTKAVSPPRFWQLVDMINMMFKPPTVLPPEPEPLR